MSCMWMGVSPWWMPSITSGRNVPASRKPAIGPPTPISQVAAAVIQSASTPPTGCRTKTTIRPPTSRVRNGVTMMLMVSGITRWIRR